MFGPESAQVLTQLTGIATVALENSRLYERAEHRAALQERHLIADLLKRFADVPIVWVGVEPNILRLYTSHLLPARSAGLIEAIRQRTSSPAASAHTPTSSGGIGYAS